MRIIDRLVSKTKRYVGNRVERHYSNPANYRYGIDTIGQTWTFIREPYPPELGISPMWDVLPGIVLPAWNHTVASIEAQAVDVAEGVSWANSMGAASVMYRAKVMLPLEGDISDYVNSKPLLYTASNQVDCWTCHEPDQIIGASIALSIGRQAGVKYSMMSDERAQAIKRDKTFYVGAKVWRGLIDPCKHKQGDWLPLKVKRWCCSLCFTITYDQPSWYTNLPVVRVVNGNLFPRQDIVHASVHKVDGMSFADFVGTMARRLVKVGDFDFEQAVLYSIDLLRLMGVPFGHKDYGWSTKDAWTIISEDLENWDDEGKESND